MMYRGDFYPAGREKLHALGALDMALWDIKGKALGVPIYRLLGGVARKYIECYSTSPNARIGSDEGSRSRGGDAPAMSLKERARATIEAGFRCFRTGPGDLPGGSTYNTHERIPVIVEDCEQIREGVGKAGDWAIDFHTRFDFSDTMRLAALLEPLAPYFVEDPLRADAVEAYPELRAHTKVPIAAGEQWGCRWDFNKLVENQLIDYLRATLPNVGGITEYTKIAALCETHLVGLIPHFTGPISTVALIHCVAPFSGPVLFEFGGSNYRAPHLPQWAEFKEGKWWFNDRPGLGIEFDASKCRQIAEITEPIGDQRSEYHRPDGSFTQW
jgi:L-alanine-DL-glutamate epimerase-like enolase superfamily enzyme